MSLIDSRIFDHSRSFYDMFTRKKEINKTHYATLICKILESGARLYKFDERPAIKVIKEIEDSTGEAGIKYDVYALVKFTKRKAVDTDYADGHYYWTDAEDIRRRIQDLDTEHLRGILMMPDFKASRLTPEMRRAIQREINRRENYYLETRA